LVFRSFSFFVATKRYPGLQICFRLSTSKECMHESEKKPAECWQTTPSAVIVEWRTNRKNNYTVFLPFMTTVVILRIWTVSTTAVTIKVSLLIVDAREVISSPKSPLGDTDTSAFSTPSSNKERGGPSKDAKISIIWFECRDCGWLCGWSACDLCFEAVFFVSFLTVLCSVMRSKGFFLLPSRPPPNVLALVQFEVILGSRLLFCEGVRQAQFEADILTPS